MDPEYVERWEKADTEEDSVLPPSPKCSKTSRPKSVPKQSTLYRFGFTAADRPGGSTCAPVICRPTSENLCGLKVFSDDEMREARGLEADYRRFWNDQVTELSSNSAVRIQLGNKSGMVGAIKTKWVLHKVDLLQLQYDELQKLAVVYGDKVTVSHKLESAQNNLTRMHKARVAVEETYGKINMATLASNKAKLSAQLAMCMSELRKAQEAFQKAYKRRVEEITVLQQNWLPPNTEVPVVDDPIAEDFDKMVQQIKNKEPDIEDLQDDTDYTLQSQSQTCSKSFSCSASSDVSDSQSEEFEAPPKMLPNLTIHAPLRGLSAYESSSEESYSP